MLQTMAMPPSELPERFAGAVCNGARVSYATWS